MKIRSFLFSVMMVFASTAWAEMIDTTSVIDDITSYGNVRILAPEAFKDKLVVPKAGNIQESIESMVGVDNSQTAARVGYRVQVFDDNNPATARQDAQKFKQQMETRFPEFRAYIQFNSPYWRVKVGDFKTRSEAEAAMDGIRQAFPSIGSIRVVRDRINSQQQ